MIIAEAKEFFKNRSDENGIPNIKFDEWVEFIKLYSKDDIRESLAKYIHENNVSFPLKRISEEDLTKLFKKFSSTSVMVYYKEFADVKERYEYKYRYSDNPLGVIDKSHYYNPVSDYFQQKNRMKCGSNSSSAPIEIWNDFEKLKKMNWTFWRLGIMEGSNINEKSFRSAFRLGTYTATQFKPSVAKALYEKHRAVNVLDTSCGWGDRLAGFYATPSTKLYVGCDPNPEVFEVYKEQCLFYEKCLGSEATLTEEEDYFECVGKKTVKIWRKPSEDVNWDLYIDTFDLYFTSPPYFETEKYGASGTETGDQSWFRYNSFEKWKHDFFFKVTEMVWKTIKKDGFMMINIIEPSSKGKRMPLCDDMVNFFKTFEDCNYIGKIGMRMMARPNATELKQVFIEPIWTFRKSNCGYIETATLMEFFA
jgi:hypothetical protein